jgi:hypothetical protein
MTVTYIAWDTGNQVGKTGDVANHTLRWVKDGTASAPTNAASEVSAAYCPGLYKVTLTSTETDANLGTLAGISSTSGVSIIPKEIQFERLPDAAPAASGGLLTVGTGTGQINPSSGKIACTIAAGDLATDSITAAALKADAVAEIQSGLSTLTVSDIRSAVGLASANLDTQLSGIVGYIDTEVAAIKAKTDNLPASPASASDCLTAAGVRSAIGLASANLDTQLATIAGYIDTEVAAIKAKTDTLPSAFPTNFASLAITSGGAVSLSASGLDAVTIETGLNARQALAIIASASAGVLAGANTTTVTIAAAGVPATNRITATVDSDDNRLSVTLTPPS